MSQITASPTPTEAELKVIEHSADNLKFAMWLYIASEIIIFTIFIVGYVIFRYNNADIVHHLHDEMGTTGILLVSFNTFLLLTSSWAMVMGLRQIQRDNRKGLINWLSLTAILGTAFVLLQYYEYKQLGSKGVTLYFSETSQWGNFGMNFYTPTSFHGAHVVIGVIWCLFVINHARKGGYSKYSYYGVEVFGLFWHFVDVVWIILFTLIYLI